MHYFNYSQGWFEFISLSIIIILIMITIVSRCIYLSQLACAGAVVAAAFSIDKILDINRCCTFAIGIIQTTISVPEIIIDPINPNIRQRTEATAAVAIVAGLVIPLGILMIILRLCKISAGALGRIIVIAVNNYYLLM